MAFGKPIRHALRHSIGLFPNNIVTKIEAYLVTKGKSGHPRHSDKVFVFASGNVFVTSSIAYRTAIARLLILFGVFGIVSCSFSRTCITISDIQPQRTLRLQHPIYLCKHLSKFGNVLSRRLLQSYLTINIVVSKSEVGRRSNATVYAVIGEFPQSSKAVFVIYLIIYIHRLHYSYNATP